jgi:hypothetical protein
MGQHHSTGYSAAVQIWLDVAGTLVQLSHAAATYVIAKTAIDLPPSDANLVFTVDAVRYERPVRLVRGMSSTKRRARILSRDDLPF